MLGVPTYREQEQPFDSPETAFGNVVKLWRGNLKDSDIGNFRIVPLNSSVALASEGCTLYRYGANYDADCARGFVQVLSIRDFKGNRLAMLSLRFSCKGWCIEEIVGPRGEDISSITFTWLDENGKYNELDEPTDLHFLAQEVVRILNREDKNGTRKQIDC